MIAHGAPDAFGGGGHRHVGDAERGKRYDFSNKAEETALREWCAENGIEPSET
jgi:hypothetical protein